MRLGFQYENGKCVFTSEWDKFAQRTYLVNYGEIAHGDIRLIDTKMIPNHDILLAGFPCQSFSQAGLKKGFSDTRGTLFFEIQRILVDKKPKAFLLENVKQLKGHDKGRTLATIISILRGESTNLPGEIELSDAVKKTLSIPLNYEVHMQVLSSRDFGLPQHRERVFIVGFDKNQVSKKSRLCFEFPKPSGVETRVGQILKEHSEDELDVLTLSDRLWNGHKLRRKKHAAKGNGFGCNVVTADDNYTMTMSARYYKDGAEILVDQSGIGRNPRKLSPREAAFLQGFPSRFDVSAVSPSQMYKQCGNAVSVNVIKAIAKNMVGVLKMDTSR
jgi:DNA (cytosine-5)-methyltransferase 1